MIAIPISFSDYYIPHSKIPIVYKRFRYQRPWVTPDVKDINR